MLRKLEAKRKNKARGKLNARGLNGLKEKVCSNRRSKKKIKIDGPRTPELISIKLGVNNIVPIIVKKKKLFFLGSNLERK